MNNNLPENTDVQLEGLNYSRNKLIEELHMMMGGSQVEIELDSSNYDLSINLALEIYRSRSSGSVIERFPFLELQTDQTYYILPKETITVRSILRQGIGATTSSGAYFDPFSAANTNLILRPMTGAGSGGYGMLTFELFNDYQSLAARMFGAYITFSFNEVTKELRIDRDVRAPETVMLWVHTYRPEVELLNDMYARPWIRRYALAQCKIQLGTAYAKYSNIVGPSGGTTLPADALKSEGKEEIDRLEDDLKMYADGGTPLGFIIG